MIREIIKAMSGHVTSGVQKAQMIVDHWKTGGSATDTGKKLSYEKMDLTYRQYPWVRGSVDIIANTVAQLDPIIRVKPEKMDANGKETDEQKEQIEQTNELLAKPNEKKQSWSEIIKMNVKDMGKYDRGAWEFEYGDIKDDTTLQAIYAVDGSTIFPVVDRRGVFKDPDKKAYIQAMEGQTSKEVETFAEKEIAILAQYVSSSSMFGLSPIETLWDFINTEDNAMKYNAAFLNPKNNNMAAGILGLQDVSFDEAKQYQELWDEANKNYKGRGRIRFVNSRVDFNDITLKSSDMQLDKFSDYLLRGTTFVYHIPMFFLGFIDKVNRSNAESQMKLFWEHAIKPVLNVIAWQFDTNVLARLGFTDIEYTYSELEEEQDAELELTRIEKHLKLGVRTVNEVRSELGYKPLDWGDTHSFNGSAYIEVPKVPKPNGEGTPGGNEHEAVEDDDSGEQKADTDKEDLTTEEGEQLSERGRPYTNTKVEGFSESRHELLKKNRMPTEEVERNLDDKIKKYWNDSMEKINKNLTSVWEKEGTKAFSDRFQKMTLKRISTPVEMYKGYEGESFKFPTIVKKGEADFMEIVDDGFSEEELTKIISGNMRAGYIVGRNQGLYDVGSAATFSDPPVDAIDWWKKHAGETSSKITNLAKGQVKQDILTALNEGMSIPQTRNLIKTHWDEGIIFKKKPLKRMNPKAWSELVARTEINRASNRGRLDQWITMDIQKKQWLAHMDDRTSEICEELDGKIVSVTTDFTFEATGETETKEDFSGPSPPAHPNCRSTLIIPSSEMRRIRDQ